MENKQTLFSPALYLGVLGFKSWAGQRLSCQWFFKAFLSTFRRMSGYYLKQLLDCFRILYHLFPTKYNSFFLSFFLSCRCRGLLLHLITFKDSRTHSLGRTLLEERSARRRDLYLTTRNTHKRHPCPRCDSNPHSQQASGRRPTPQTARPPRSANYNSTPCNPIYWRRH